MDVESNNPSNANTQNIDANQNNQTNGEQKSPLENFIPGQSAQEPTQGQNVQQPQAAQAKKKSNFLPYIAIFAVIIIAASAFFFFSKAPHYATTTTIISATTIKQPTMAEITNCTVISKPGKYYLAKSISTALAKGACISIYSSNVEIVGNQNKIKGDGPFVGVPPFTYGIMASNVSNVTITGVNITRFSFGVYFENVMNSTISYSNITKNTISNIFLNNSYNNYINSVTASVSSSSYGSIDIFRGGNNIFLNDSLYGNAYYGFVVNSTGNKFIRDSLSNNPQDFVCYDSSGFADANLFNNVKCENNMGCNFAWCSVSNKELNMSKIQLAPNITSCGTILSSGRYTLNRNLSGNSYFNMSNPDSKSIPCIKIASPDVVLNCKGHAIENTGYAISLSGNFNETIENCTLINNVYGLYLNNTLYPNIENITFKNNTYGLYLNNMNSGTALYLTGNGNRYGVFINNSNSFTLSNFNFSNGKYGVYVNTPGSNIYNNGYLSNNKYGDLYCTASSYNVSTSSFTDVSCGLTDCNWGTTCARHALPPISTYPLSACTNITIPGNYSLSAQIKATPNCFNIKTSNVNFNCNNKNIVGNGAGSAFAISNVSNVSVSNCNISLFGGAFVVENASYITIQNTNISKVGYGIKAINLSYAKIINNNLSTFSNYGFYFNRLYSSIANSNKALNGINGSTGFAIYNSTHNIFAYNNATQNPSYGFFIYNSGNNTIFNNSAYSNKLDWYCSPSVSGVYAENGGVNFGFTKNNCHWLVELNSQSLSYTPLSISSSSSISLTQDLLYPYGEMLFNIYNTKQSSANNTVINCNYHTILATHGGTFANIANSSNVKIENCYIKNFTYGIKSGSGSYLVAINNTILNSSIAISTDGSSYPKIINNTILNASYGVLLINTNYGNINYNHLANSNISIELSGGAGYQIANNRAKYGSIGMYIINSTIDTLANNIFENMSRYGIICTGLSTNSSSLNKDAGGNICSSNFACYWMTSSPMCKA